MIHTNLKNYDISCTFIFNDIYCNFKLSRMLYCMVYTLNINYFTTFIKVVHHFMLLFILETLAYDI